MVSHWRFYGRTVTRADEDVSEIYARNIGMEICNELKPIFHWNEDDEDTNDDYVTAAGWSPVSADECLPQGSLNSWGLSDWHSGSPESSAQSLVYHPLAHHS